MTSSRSSPSHASTLSRLVAAHPSCSTDLVLLSRCTTTWTPRWSTCSESYEIKGKNCTAICLECRIPAKSLSGAWDLVGSLTRFVEQRLSTLSLIRVSAERDSRARATGLGVDWIISLTVGLTESKDYGRSWKDYDPFR